MEARSGRAGETRGDVWEGRCLGGRQPSSEGVRGLGRQHPCPGLSLSCPCREASWLRAHSTGHPEARAVDPTGHLGPGPAPWPLLYSELSLSTIGPWVWRARCQGHWHPARGAGRCSGRGGDKGNTDFRCIFWFPFSNNFRITESLAKVPQKGPVCTPAPAFPDANVSHKHRTAIESGSGQADNTTKFSSYSDSISFPLAHFCVTPRSANPCGKPGGTCRRRAQVGSPQGLCLLPFYVSCLLTWFSPRQSPQVPEGET